MSVISGKWAYVNGVPCTASWQASEVADVKTYAASCTGGGMAAIEGNVNWTGTINGIGPEPPAGLRPGLDFVFKGVIDNTVADAITLDGTIRTSQLTVTIPVASSDVIRWAVTFGAQGLLTKTTVGAADGTTPIPAKGGKYGKVRIDPDGVDFLVPDVQAITITLNAPMLDYVSNGAMYRKSGPLEASISFDVLNRDPAVANYDVNTYEVVDIYVSATQFWRFADILWKEKTNINVDAAGALVGYSVNGIWSALLGVGADPGYIKCPNNTYLFGVEPAP